MKERVRETKLFQLLSKQSDYKPTSFFSERLNVSEKTIYNDIKRLNHELDLYGISIAKLPRHGIKLSGKSDKIEKFLNQLEMNKMTDDYYSSIDRQCVIMKALVVESKKISLEELAMKCYVSQTSIRVDLEKCKQFFNGLDAQVHSTNNGTVVIGKELDIQKSFIAFFFEKLEKEYGKRINDLEEVKNFAGKMFDYNFIETTSQCLKMINDKSYRILTDNYMTSLFVTILLLIARVESKKHVERQNEFAFQNIKHMEPYMIAIDVASEINRTLGINLKEEDIEYLSAVLFAHGIEPSYKEFYPNQRYCEVVNQMIKKCSEILKIDFTKDKKLNDSLMFHIVPMIYRLINGFKIKNPLLETIKKQYMMMFSITWYAAAILETEFDVSLNDDEVAFLTVHLQVAFDRKYKPKNILVVCPIGLSTSELAYNKIRQVIPSRDNVETASFEQVYQNDLSDVDLIISLTKLENIDKKIIYVSPIVTESEIQQITESYLFLNQEFCPMREVGIDKNNYLDQFFDQKFVFVNMNFKTKEECIDFFIHRYRDELIVTSEFGASIYSREMLGATSIDTGVAIPHASPNTVLKTKIGIMTLQKPIIWESVEVSLIIMFAVAKDDADKLKGVMVHLYDAIDTKEKVKQLSKMETPKELIKILME